MYTKNRSAGRTAKDRKRPDEAAAEAEAEAYGGPGRKPKLTSCAADDDDIKNAPAKDISPRSIYESPAIVLMKSARPAPPRRQTSPAVRVLHVYIYIYKIL